MTQMEKPILLLEALPKEPLSIAIQKDSTTVLSSVSLDDAKHSSPSASEPNDGDEDDSELECLKPITHVNAQSLKKKAAADLFQCHIKDRQPADESELPSPDGDPFVERQGNSESLRIIDQVRDYQQELFERAKEENVIAVLDTGSGKTLIACLLIRHILEQERLRRAEGQQQKVICFLANSVHLVKQQARVLANNLIEEPAVLYGSSNLNLWNASTWVKIKAEHPVVVCTPAILDQALSRSCITIEEISLLVFDEAHHAKKDHPYSRLIRSYYLKAPHESRPRIFGMTASAVDTKGTKGDISTTAQALEEILHSKIVTTKDGSLFSFAPKPTDVKWIYERSMHRMPTDLYQSLFTTVKFCKDLSRGFEFTKMATRELGPWCADQAWTFIMGASVNQSSGIRRKYEQSEEYAQLSTMEERHARLVSLDEAVLLVQQHSLRELAPTSQDLSPKVLKLYTELCEKYEQDPNTRAIIFVDERLKALVLNLCFRRLKIPNVRSGTLLGSAGTASESVSIQHQEQTLARFRAGLINLIFATSVADEGLDIPQCNLGVRFDLCKTTIQYMQSRGRARMRNSFFAHMLEENNFDQEADLTYQIDNEQYIRKWCSSLAPDRRLGRGTKLAKLMAKDEGGKTFLTDAGARCDSSNALLILSRFASSLQYTGATNREVYQVEIDVEKKLFRYSVRLPQSDQCTVKGCYGDWKSTKQMAKRSAAWACCYLLRKHGQLDGQLDSKYRKVKPANMNARLAVTTKKEAYDMIIKPTQWESDVGSIPTELFATVVYFEPEQQLKHNMSSIVMLTRHKLPTFSTFVAFVDGCIKVNIKPKLVPNPFAVAPEEVDCLTAFTLRGVFQDVFNKTYEHQPEMMSYWLAPLSENACLRPETLHDLVSPYALSLVPEERTQWSVGMLAEMWEDKFLSDPLNGKFHYFTGKVIPDKKITDAIPDNIPLIAQKKRSNIIDFSNSTWTAAKKKISESDIHDMNQPVLQADLISTRRNFLDPVVAQDLIACHIAPQFLQIARVDVGFGASCLVWPAIVHRLESYMIALEAFDKLGLPGIPADLALETFTKDADNNVEEAQTHAGGSRGMGKNYERLEFIGDCFLKMSTTLAVFVRTTCDEAGMHCRRMEMLCNRTLFNVAVSKDLELYQYARTLGFDRTTWYPEHLLLRSGRGARKDSGPVKHSPKSQSLGMKTIADMSEAIIGATIVANQHFSSDAKRFDVPIQAVSVLVQSPDHNVQSWNELIQLYKSPTWTLRTNDPVAQDRACLIASKLGYKFKQPCLLRSAFTHSSDTNSPVPDLQRLEFLGDAVLDYVSIAWLFNSNPNRDPQWLTEHKMAMVSNQFLAALAVTLDFDKLIFVTTVKLIGRIQIYADKIRQAMSLPDCPRSFWVDIESPPKALSDLVESYLGAVFVDSGFDYCEIERFFERHVKPFFEDITEYDSFAHKHPTTFLHNKLARDFKCSDYRIMDGESPAKAGSIEPCIVAGVIIHNQIVSDGQGTSARYAKIRASKMALAKLEGLSRSEFAVKFGCDCTTRARLDRD